MNNHNIILKVNGKSYGGWTEARVVQSLDQISGSFAVSITNPYPNMKGDFGIRLGQPCSVEINDQTIITGFIEDMPIEYDSKNHTIEIAGRDKTGDLVDCTYIEPIKEWKNQSISNIVDALCKPFGIEVAIDESVIEEATITDSVFNIPSKARKKYPTFNSNTSKMELYRANEGETVFEIIVRFCRTKAIIPVSYGDGRLTLTRAGSSRTIDSLILGKNIKAGRLNQSNKDRYSRYEVKGHDTQDPFKEIFNYTQPNAFIEDKIVTRYRPITILSDIQINLENCQKRAAWEMSVRAGRSRSIEYEVQGWTQSNGIIWPLNHLVKVRDTNFGINDTLLISKLEFSVNKDDGSITKITVCPQAAYMLAEEALKKISTKNDLWNSIDWNMPDNYSPYDE